MAQQTINVGTSPNDGTGTPLRTAFQYTNSNFSELYTAVGPSGNNIVVPGTATISGDLTVDTSTLKVDSTNNRVGVNNASPTVALDVVGSGLLSTGLVVGTSATNNSLDIVGPSSGTNAGCQLTFKNGATANAIIGTYSRVIGGAYNESLAFYSNSKDFVFYSGSERLRIASDGVATWSNVGGVAGTAMTLNSTGLGVGGSPASKLYVYGANVSGIGQFRIDCPAAGVAQQTFAINGVSQGQVYADGTQFVIGSATSTPLLLRTANTVAVTIDASQNVGVGVTPSGSGGCLQLKSGITFPATQVASSDPNTLDDYEEGTWTIGIAFGGASTGITYSQNTGKYTKVGRLVTVFGSVDLTNKGSATGNASITGLPFSIGGASSDYSAASLQLVNITFANFPMGFGNPTTTTIPLQEVTNAGVRTNLTDADFANNSAIIFSLTYSV